jgi:regulatory protein
MATRKKPRKLKPGALQEAALHYLGRYAASTARVRQVMTRRIRNSAKAHDFDPTPFLAELETVIATLIRTGLLNDAGFAEAKARSLNRRGGSKRLIAAKLAASGVRQPEAVHAIARLDEEVPDAEFAAAVSYAKRRRLGIFRNEPDDSQERRRKDLAAMARAGFAFALAHRALGRPDDLDG